jgi:hypothetical protein
MKKLVTLIICVAVAGAAAGYYFYPKWTLDRAVTAVEKGDVILLESIVDWQRVRSGLKADFVAPALANMPNDQSGFGILGAAIGANLANTLVDSMVSAPVIIDRARNGDFVERWRRAAATNGRFVSLTTYAVDIAPPDRPDLRAALILELQGVEWRIVRLLPSAEMIKELKAVSSGADSRPAKTDRLR